MAGTSTAGNAGPVAHPALAQGKSQRAQRRRRASFVGRIILIPASLGLVLLVAAGLLLLTHHKDQSRSASALASNNFGSAKVLIDSADGSGCRQEVFDNKTWRMTQSQQPCDAATRDANGIPVPVGTVRRLDAISKSFLGK
jgi:hypothetical protein